MKKPHARLRNRWQGNMERSHKEMWYDVACCCEDGFDLSCSIQGIFDQLSSSELPRKDSTAWVWKSPKWLLIYWLQVWDQDEHENWHLTASWKAHSGSVWKVTWAHPEFGQVLATCSFDRTAAVWEEIGK